MHLWNEHNPDGDASNDVITQVLAHIISGQPAEAGKDVEEDPL